MSEYLTIDVQDYDHKYNMTLQVIYVKLTVYFGPAYIVHSVNQKYRIV